MPAVHTFTPDDDRAVRAVLTSQRDAWNKGDLDGYMAGYAKSPDTVFTALGTINHGWQATYDRYAKKYADRAQMGHLELDVLSVQALGADGAIVLGKWALTGTELAAHGVFSLGMARDATGWHVVHDHTSVDAQR